MIQTNYQHTFAGNGEVEKLDSEVSKKVIDLQEYELTAEGHINPFNKNNKPVTTNWVQNLLKKYGIYQNINNWNITNSRHLFILNRRILNKYV